MDEKKGNIRGEKIKQAINLTGITQAELAHKLNIAPGSLAQWINGRRNPSMKTLERIAITLDIPISFFLSNKKVDLKYLLNEFDTKDTSYVPLYEISEANNERFILAEQPATYINFPLTGDHQFAIRMEGNSMLNPNNPKSSIQDGDFLIIDPDSVAFDGCVVLARISANYCTVKRMYTEDDRIALVSDNNPKKEFFEGKKSEVKILGRVIYLSRNIGIRAERPSFIVFKHKKKPLH